MYHAAPTPPSGDGILAQTDGHQNTRHNPLTFDSISTRATKWALEEVEGTLHPNLEVGNPKVVGLEACWMGVSTLNHRRCVCVLGV